MCGIFALSQPKNHNLIPVVLEHLKKLEYRGYDSAGIAATQNASIHVVKNVGPTENLVIPEELKGNTAIAHVRWATHGGVTQQNAHPHMSGSSAIVHNGIIENHVALKETFNLSLSSETDSEVIVALYNHFSKTMKALEAFEATVDKLEGSWAIVMIDHNTPNTLFVSANKSPLVIGKLDEGFVVSSDPGVLSDLTHSVHYLKDLSTLALNLDQLEALDLTWQTLESHQLHKKLEMDFYTLQEIYEQPSALMNTLNSELVTLSRPKHIVFAASGSSYHVACIAAQLFETFAQIPCRVYLSSEMRYQAISWPSNTALIALSQSGETADTLEAVRHWKKYAFYALSITNVANSSLDRLTQYQINSIAGNEVGVGATKTVTSMLLQMMRIVQQWSPDSENPFSDFLASIDRLKITLTLRSEIRKHALMFVQKSHTFILGRGIFYPVAQEFALKIKELAYLHAEAFSSGELKHGPLALIEKGTPVIVMAFKNFQLAKTISNIEEVLARGANVLVITDANLNELCQSTQLSALQVPFEVEQNDLFSVLAIAQLLTYELAIHKNINPDRPRNLAKCVTVE